MADFKDLEEGQTAKWQGIFDSNEIALDKQFPWDYFPKNIGGKPILDIVELSNHHPKKAICMLFFYAVYDIMQSRPLDFITKPELNIEFNDLLNQAAHYGIDIPSSNG